MHFVKSYPLRQTNVSGYQFSKNLTLISDQWHSATQWHLQASFRAWHLAGIVSLYKHASRLTALNQLISRAESQIRLRLEEQPTENSAGLGNRPVALTIWIGWLHQWIEKFWACRDKTLVVKTSSRHACTALQNLLSRNIFPSILSAIALLLRTFWVEALENLLCSIKRHVAELQVHQGWGEIQSETFKPFMHDNSPV